MTGPAPVSTPAEDVAAEARRLRDGLPAWAGADVADRVRALEAWWAALLAHRDELVDALSRATGRRALSEMEVDSVGANIVRCSTWARQLADEHRPVPTSDPGVLAARAPVPLGLVGVVAPWNFPLQLALIDAVPALLAGCAVLVKPSEWTPDFVPVLRRTIDTVDALRPVFGIVPGGPDTGRAVVDTVDAVCFTGSVPTGRAVLAAAAARFVPCFCELGGKDPAVVCAGADLDVAAAGVLWGATANTGQSCMSIERVYAHRSVFDPFVDRLVRLAGTVRLAIPGPGDGELGPFIDPHQAGVVRAHLNDALDRGARVLCGGRLREAGGRAFLPPTVVVGVDHSMRLMTEETFGPVIPVMPFAGTDEAVALANGTDYGLSAAVFGSAEDVAAIAPRLLAGGISVNDVLLTAMLPEHEKQAFGCSGLGPSRMGPMAVRRFTRQRVILTRTAPRVQPWWHHPQHC